MPYMRQVKKTKKIYSNIFYGVAKSLNIPDH